MKRILSVLILAMLLSSCGRQSDDIYNVNKKIANMISYSANAEIIIIGNKGESEYKVKQYYSEPDKLRIETLEPEFLKGKILVYNGGKWGMYHPYISSSIQIEKLRNEDELIYLGVIQKSMAAFENVEYKYVSRDGNEYVAVKCNIPGGNEYRHSAVLYFTRKDYYPEFMEILDDREDMRIRINYYDFEYNSKLEEALFQLK